jgi:hypothetical protein
MIHNNNQTCINIFNELQSDINYTKLENNIILTLKDSLFPGALIPYNNSFYICTVSQKEFNILLSLINSFIGKNYSDYDGHSIALNHENIVENILVKNNITFISKINISSVYKDDVLLIVNQMINIYKSSNYNKNSIPLSIGRLIDNFKESIYITNDFANAKAVIAQIKQEYRLDALNITFMEIELAYSFQNWNDIVNHKLIYQIINARKPLIIRLHIIEAFFYTYLYNSTNLEYDYNQYIKSNILNLLLVCPVNTTGAIKSVYFIAYIFDNIKYTEIALIIENIDVNRYLDNKIKKQIKDKLSKEETILLENSSDKYLTAKASIIEANNIDTITKIERASYNLKKLEEDEKQELKTQILSSELNDQSEILPLNWMDWFKCLFIIDCTYSLSLAEKGLEEWEVDTLTNDPLLIDQLSEQILSLDEQFAIGRFITSLPLFNEALKRSSKYPNPLCLKIYISILELISIYDIQDQKTLLLSQDIFESILILSPNSAEYDHITQLIESIIQKINGRHYINWLIDYAEILIEYNASNIDIRNKLLELILMQIYEQKEWLESYQLKLLYKFASIVGIESLFEELINHTSKEVDIDIFEQYSGKTIGIYTLSENAGKNAKLFLEDKIENVRVILNHDKAATDALKHMSQVSDYVVIVTQSAKHAATGEIQKIRRQNNKEVLFPKGKGSSSIINTILMKNNI